MVERTKKGYILDSEMQLVVSKLLTQFSVISLCQMLEMSCSPSALKRRFTTIDRIISKNRPLRFGTYINLKLLEQGVYRQTQQGSPKYFTTKHAPISLEDGEALALRLIHALTTELQEIPDFVRRLDWVRYLNGQTNQEFFNGIVFQSVVASYALSIEKGIELCKFHNINPYWLTGKSTVMRPFVQPILPQSYRRNFTNILALNRPFQPAFQRKPTNPAISKQACLLLDKYGAKELARLMGMPTKCVEGFRFTKCLRYITIEKIKLAMRGEFPYERNPKVRPTEGHELLAALRAKHGDKLLCKLMGIPPCQLLELTTRKFHLKKTIRLLRRVLKGKFPVKDVALEQESTSSAKKPTQKQDQQEESSLAMATLQALRASAQSIQLAS